MTSKNKHRVILGTFSAASNVSGIKVDTKAVSALMHKYGGFAVFDYATAAPYVPIDMEPSVRGSEDGDYSKDAVAISTHKFIGGPGTPGLLIIRKSILVKSKPQVCGGGTVKWVGPTSHEYVDNIEEREEGGTPEIIGSIRAGLVFQLKDRIGAETIEAIENDLVWVALPRLVQNDNIHVLGNLWAKRLPVVSFNIRAPTLDSGSDRQFLHFNFVAALLNDLFGIQARGGCACAGPYGQKALGFEDNKGTDSESHMKSIYAKKPIAVFKGGFVRICLHFLMTKEEVDYMIKSIEFVAKHGWKFLPFYGYCVKSGHWEHKKFEKLSGISLRAINFSMKSDDESKKKKNEEKTRMSFEDTLRAAKLCCPTSDTFAKFEPASDTKLLEDYPGKCWFMLPFQAVKMLSELSPDASESDLNPRDLRCFTPRTRQRFNLGDCILDLNKRTSDGTNDAAKSPRNMRKAHKTGKRWWGK
mmetsp:Transcript_20270/g.49747  ORF Transcript_20270/g.49747 Transcript_20270/m.49747 type:complete len:471 (-) Transcript_20270:135-1547(-)